MEERKSMGSALVDVFDAGVVLVKSEINGVARKAGEIAKAKGIGVALVLASVGPLVMGLIFLLLWFFYLLRGWGLADSMAAFVIAALSLLVTGALIFLGMQKLSAEVKSDAPRYPVPLEPQAQGATFAAGAFAAGATSAGPVAKAPAPSDAKHDAMGAPSSPDDLLGEVLGDSRASRTVYESQPSGEAQFHGSGLNKKLNDHHDDPNLQNPVVLRDGPGISVSTRPTYSEDMKREGY